MENQDSSSILERNRVSEDPAIYRSPVESQPGKPRVAPIEQEARRMYACAALSALIGKSTYPEGSLEKLTRLAFEFADKMMEEERINWSEENQSTRSR